MCNPSYIEGTDQEDHSSNITQQGILEIQSQNIPSNTKEDGTMILLIFAYCIITGMSKQCSTRNAFLLRQVM
jgi:hypothetical protein